jgi:glycosyltransferase involved in cell wall biosynthesis
VRPALLFLAHLLPWPLEGGGQIKSYHFLKALAQDFDITMIAFSRSESEQESTGPLAPLCSGGVTLVPLARGRVRDLAVAARSALSGTSFLMERDNVAAMHRAVEAALAQKKFVAIHVDHLQMSSFVPKDTCGARVVLDQHNVEHRIPQRMAATVRNPAVRLFASGEWRRLAEFEKRALERADRTIAVSREDQQIFQGMAEPVSDRIVAIPIGVDLEFFGSVAWRPGGTTLLSVGTMYWPPNVDGALYFYREIFPKIKQQMPEAVLQLVGPKPTPEITSLGDDPAVEVTGLVPDIRPYAAACGVFIVPLRSGSGMRVKILNAMAMGVPIVSTTVGAEGIEVTDGENLLLADGPQPFADACVRVLRDASLAAHLASGGRALMERRYGWETVGKELRDLYREVIAG